MNIPDNTPTPESAERKALVELKKAHASLRTMFHLMALCALMLTGTIFIMFYKQVAVLQRQIEEMNVNAKDYQTKFLPQLEIVRGNLEAFAQTNQSLTPLLQRYFPTNLVPANTPKSSAARNTNNAAK